MGQARWQRLIVQSAGFHMIRIWRVTNDYLR
jgi:hypothetical protein